MNKVIGFLTIGLIIGLGCGIIGFNVFEGGVLGMDDNRFPTVLVTLLAVLFVWGDMSMGDEAFDTI